MPNDLITLVRPRVVTLNKSIEPLPQIGILDWPLVGGAPAVALPVLDPLGDALLQVFGIRVQLHAHLSLQHIGRLQGFQRCDGCHYFHAVVGGGGFRPRQLLTPLLDAVPAVYEDAPPAAGTRVSGAGPVRIDDHLPLLFGLLRHGCATSPSSPAECTLW